MERAGVAASRMAKTSHLQQHINRYIRVSPLAIQKARLRRGASVMESTRPPPGQPTNGPRPAKQAAAQSLTTLGSKRGSRHPGVLSAERLTSRPCHGSSRGTYHVPGESAVCRPEGTSLGQRQHQACHERGQFHLRWHGYGVDKNKRNTKVS